MPFDRNKLSGAFGRNRGGGVEAQGLASFVSLSADLRETILAIEVDLMDRFGSLVAGLLRDERQREASPECRSASTWLARDFF